MKASMEFLYKLFLNMQMQKSFPVYQVNFPFKSQLYIDICRSIVDFEFLKPASLIDLIKKKLNIFTSDGKPMPANLKRLGMQSDDILESLIPFLTIIALIILGMLFVSIFYVFPSLREKIQNFIKDKYKKFKWNGALRSATIAYLKLSISLCI